MVRLLGTMPAGSRQETEIRATGGVGPLIPCPASSPEDHKRTGFISTSLHVMVIAEVDRLVSLGATRIDIGQGDVD